MQIVELATICLTLRSCIEGHESHGENKSTQTYKRKRMAVDVIGTGALESVDTWAQDDSALHKIIGYKEINFRLIGKI